jgi:hypothetical protein
MTNNIKKYKQLKNYRILKKVIALWFYLTSIPLETGMEGNKVITLKFLHFPPATPVCTIWDYLEKSYGVVIKEIHIRR